MAAQSLSDVAWMRQALRLAARARGRTSPNPLVGAILVRGGRLLGQGWHHQAGGPHAEIEALRDAVARGESVRGATLYVTLEPCCTHGRTPPCTDAIRAAGIRRVVVAAVDPNPAHAGRGLRLLRRAGIRVEAGVLGAEATLLNESFNHWIVQRTPWVMVKAAMTLDGRIATASGESKWITGPDARAEGMRLRDESDAILAGINTVLCDDPSLTIRLPAGPGEPAKPSSSSAPRPALRRVILDSRARTPLKARVVSDADAGRTIIVVTREAPARRVAALRRRVQVWVAPRRGGRIDLRWVLRRLGAESVTRLLVEGGGEVNASFLESGLAHEIAFFYAPKILGGEAARRGVAGAGATRLANVIELDRLEWRRLGDGARPDLFLRALVKRA
jgi:diaminohydroxyphosphoribosylaminopyrimidine deaminase/5-amino-6-(5-phosphoribosylamino)uracil reductase